MSDLQHQPPQPPKEVLLGLIGIGRGFSPLPPTAPLIRVRKWRLAYYQVEVSKRYQVSTAPWRGNES